tara:strand:- start:139 stop:717 length:579 start_codon:yes stop_codon:yes gene_type:complete
MIKIFLVIVVLLKVFFVCAYNTGDIVLVPASKSLSVRERVIKFFSNVDDFKYRHVGVYVNETTLKALGKPYDKPMHVGVHNLYDGLFFHDVEKNAVVRRVVCENDDDVDWAGIIKRLEKERVHFDKNIAHAYCYKYQSCKIPQKNAFYCPSFTSHMQQLAGRELKSGDIMFDTLDTYGSKTNPFKSCKFLNN